METGNDYICTKDGQSFFDHLKSEIYNTEAVKMAWVKKVKMKGHSHTGRRFNL